MLTEYYILQDMCSDDNHDSDQTITASETEDNNNSSVLTQSTPVRSPDIRYFINESTSDVDLVEQITTDTDLRSSVTSSEDVDVSTGSLTPEYEGHCLQSYRDLLYYSPCNPELPQTDDNILVPVKCMLDDQLRVIPMVEVNRIPALEDMVSSLQDHSPPLEDEVIYVNSSPEVIKISSESDTTEIE